MYSTNNNNAPHSPAQSIDPPYIPAPPPPPPTFAEPSHAYAAPLPEMVTPAIDPRLKTAGIAILASALVLLVGVLTRSWFTATDGKEGGVGLLGIEACRRGLCQTASWFDIPRVPSQIPIFATTALIACVTTVVMLFHTATMLLKGTAERVRLRYLVPALSCAVLGSGAFVASIAFANNMRGLTLGWSTVVGFAGLLATGITTLVMVRPLTRTA